MTDQDGRSVREIAWSEIFPWLLLARCFRIAIQVRLLALGGVGLFLTLLGWIAIGQVFSGNPRVEREVGQYDECPWLAATERFPWTGNQWVDPDRSLQPDTGMLPRLHNSDWETVAGWRGPFWRTWEPLWSTWEFLGRPFQRIYLGQASPAELAFYLLCGLWTILVWGFFGGAMTRAAAYQLTTEERLGTGAALRFAAKQWRSYFAGPIIPLLGLFFVGLGVSVLGLLLSFDASVIVAGILWPLALIGGVLLALLFFGLFLGWPLLWGSVSSDGPDSFEAIGRAYNYTYQRPLHYLFYATVAALLGAIGWAAVQAFFTVLLGLTNWAAAWWVGQERFTSVVFGPLDLQSARGIGAVVLRFWIECVKLLAVGYLFSYFWSATAGIYLLMRRQVDAVELDEVFLEDESQEPPMPLPPVRPEPETKPEEPE